MPCSPAFTLSATHPSRHPPASEQSDGAIGGRLPAWENGLRQREPINDVIRGIVDVEIEGSIAARHPFAAATRVKLGRGAEFRDVGRRAFHADGIEPAI